MADEEGSKKSDKRKPVQNGDVLDGYRWTQTLKDVSVYVPVPDGTRGKMCVVQFSRGSLKVGLKGKVPLIDGKLCDAVKPDDCTWSLEDSNLIAVELSKVHDQKWWSRLLESDPEIDTSKIEPENSKVEDLDPEAQQLVRKMMFDQRQKQLGLPSSEELQKREMLEKFQKAHPELDFSNAKIN